MSRFEVEKSPVDRKKLDFYSFMIDLHKAIDRYKACHPDKDEYPTDTLDHLQDLIQTDVYNMSQDLHPDLIFDVLMMI